MPQQEQDRAGGCFPANIQAQPPLLGAKVSQLLPEGEQKGTVLPGAVFSRASLYTGT